MKHIITSSQFSRVQASHQDAYAEIEREGSGEISLEEIERAKLIHTKTGRERFCDRYKGTDYCVRHCQEECRERDNSRR
jgi:hypothetical protein